MGLARGAPSCYRGLFIVEYQPMEHAMPNSQEIEAKSHSPVPQGYVLGAEEGEHLIHFRDGGNIFIKVDPVTGSNNLGLGTQQLPKGLGHSGSPTPPQGRSLLRSGRQWHGHT